jgi:hypothetical protein
MPGMPDAAREDPRVEAFIDVLREGIYGLNPGETLDDLAARALAAADAVSQGEGDQQEPEIVVNGETVGRGMEGMANALGAMLSDARSSSSASSSGEPQP